MRSHTSHSFFCNSLNTIVGTYVSETFLKHIHFRSLFTTKEFAFRFIENADPYKHSCDTTKLPQGNIFVIQILRTQKYRRRSKKAERGRSIGPSSRASESESRAMEGTGGGEGLV